MSKVGVFIAVSILVILLLVAFGFFDRVEETNQTYCNNVYACEYTKYINSSTGRPEQMNYTCEQIREMIELNIYPEITNIYYCMWDCKEYKEHYTMIYVGKEPYRGYYLKNCILKGEEE